MNDSSILKVEVSLLLYKSCHRPSYLVEQVMKLLVWLASLSVSRNDDDENPESTIDTDVNVDVWSEFRR